MLTAIGAARAAELPPTLKSAPLVFTATLKEVQEGPVARSFPPIYTFRLTFENADKPLRGVLPETLGPFHFSHRGEVPPPLKIGERYLVGLKASQGMQVVAMVPASGEVLREAKAALSLPLGWSKKGDEIVSPWAARGGDWWPADAKLTAELTCAKSGRPALLAGEGIEVKVEQVPPKNLQEFKNPFGDGQFKITVTNTGKMAVSVPALIQDGDEVRWHDSLVLICQEKPFLLPSTGPLVNPHAVELAPGESVSTTIDTLLLGDDVPWPRGGSRIPFTFALGEAAADNFFYYFSNLHDAMRAESKKAFGSEK
jgi:hypothetical protein